MTRQKTGTARAAPRRLDPKLYIMGVEKFLIEKAKSSKTEKFDKNHLGGAGVPHRQMEQSTEHLGGVPPPKTNQLEQYLNTEKHLGQTANENKCSEESHEVTVPNSRKSWCKIRAVPSTETANGSADVDIVGERDEAQQPLPSHDEQEHEKCIEKCKKTLEEVLTADAHTAQRTPHFLPVLDVSAEEF